ncbi:S-methyl-5-thioribose-1-phosphate isomerase [Oceanospirillum linum]|uniref:Methylthioribose-1-phosphate isomerase n=1 Tax=Oceanospirillum linum TaxID=966 RepID=A0A1T1HCW4_OCELI|nr:S-methyl-5-thioribose-1-phosphate isomerase [Oceanospirillum linum]OOV87567.1 S-methyl-5-thioribose-1-phosphate isomerase [Oceanospirillum linum]SEF92012.1 methylthioribose-1-phosphate isomerase [Oleiphilus messinensis]SMP12824.1 methylthioribose-1-phosphate isomerase [Oceanospirillum linum]
MSSTEEKGVEAIIWRDDHLLLLDQRALPEEEVYLSYHDSGAVASAITDMVVRGAPAIGVAAAYGVVLAARESFKVTPGTWKTTLANQIQVLADARPTAVNLFWALDKMKGVIDKLDPETPPQDALLKIAIEIHESDVAANRTMGEFGADLIAETQDAGRSVMTHCNTGALATGGFGTALGVIRTAFEKGLIDHVHADETRPWFQGARLTAWELMREGIPVSLNVEGAAAHIMKTQDVSWVVVGADRITANGDVANKIGTYNLAVLALHHGVRFMVVAPTSTIDMSLEHGDDIPIEERGREEIVNVKGHQIAPEKVEVFNPVFDVTPADLIDVIVTERGVVERPTVEKMKLLMSNDRLH